MEFAYSERGVSIKLIRDTRKKDAKCLCFLKFRVTFNRISNYYPTDIELDLNDWTIFEEATDDDFKYKNRKAGHLKDVRDKLEEQYTNKYLPAVKSVAGEFSFDALNIELGSVKVANLNDAFTSKINTLNGKYKVGNAGIYESTINALTRFKHYKKLKGEINKAQFISDCIRLKHHTAGSEKDAIKVNDAITFDELTPKFLTDCEEFWRRIGIADATKGIYMRTLRAIINNKGGDPYLTGKKYPFGDDDSGKYAIPEGGRREIAIPIEQIWKIEDFNTDDYSLMLARDIFIFQYLGNGMNFGDLCRLQYADIDATSGEIIFQRKKTIKKGKKPIYIHVPILPPMQEIINRHGNKDHSAYLFPFLNGIEPTEKNERRIKDAINLALGPINNALKTIAYDLELDPNLSTSYTRNSYITHLTSELLINPIVVRKMVGHSTSKDVTAGYVNLTAKKRREINSKLLNPKKQYNVIGAVKVSV